MENKGHGETDPTRVLPWKLTDAELAETLRAANIELAKRGVTDAELAKRAAEAQAHREHLRALAGKSLGVDLEGDAYQHVMSLGEGLEPIPCPHGKKDRAEARREDEQTLSYLYGYTPTSTPEQAVYYFPETVSLVASLIHHPARLKMTAPIFDGRALQWGSGEIEAPVWDRDPGTDLAMPVALRWIEETRGETNPHYSGNMKSLHALIDEHLTEIMALWPTPVPAPPPVDAPLLLSTTKVAREPKALEEGTQIKAGRRKKLAHIPATKIITRRTDGKPVRYTALHGAVSDAITAIMLERKAWTNWLEGVPISNHEIARHLLQTKGKITPTQVEEVNAAIKDLRVTEGHIDGTDYEGNLIRLDGPLLHADYYTLKQPNGAEVEGWSVYAYPLTNRYANRLNQLRQVDLMLEGHKTKYLKRVALIYQIANTLLLWHGKDFKGPGYPYRLNYATLIERLGEAKQTGKPLTAKQVRTRQDWIKEALNHFRAGGYIKDWEPYEEGRAQKGVDIWLPEVMPPVTARQFQPLPGITAQK